MLSYVWLYSIIPFYLGGFNQTVCPTGNVFCGVPSERLAASQLHVKTLLHLKSLQ